MNASTHHMLSGLHPEKSLAHVDGCAAPGNQNGCHADHRLNYAVKTPHPSFLHHLQAMVMALLSVNRRNRPPVLPLLSSCLGIFLCLSCLNPLLGQTDFSLGSDVPFDGSSSSWNGSTAPLSGNSVQLTSAYGNFQYTDNGTSITITGYTGAGGAVTIPALINGKPVTTIGDKAFYYMPWLTSVSIPNGVISIGNSAFNNCNRLTSVSIPNSVTSMGRYAFYYCNGLTSVSIGNSVTSIGSYAFSYCSGLTSVSIPNSVTSIGDYAFLYCSALENFVVDTDNNVYASINGILFNKSISFLIQYPAANSGSTYTIPNSVTSIGGYAFAGSTALTSVSIPNSVISIGDGAFADSTALTSVSIPNSIISIGDYAFAGCTALTSVSIPNSITSIEDYAFAGCTVLTSVSIPNSITSIGDYAFTYCSGLTSVNIPNSVTSIGSYAFSYCSGLTSVSIPNSVTSIGSYAFYYGSGLTSVSIPNSVTSIGRDAFYYCYGVTSLSIGNSVTSIGDSAFSFCSGLTNVSIPNSVTSIGSYAFYYCSGLTSVSIPNSVTSIGSGVFYYCSRLTNVSIPNSVTSIGDNAFNRCDGLTSVSIPNSVTSIGSGAFAYCQGLNSAYFEGNAPASFGSNVFTTTSSTFTIYYQDNAQGFTAPTWHGYATSVITRIFGLSGNLDFGSVFLNQTATQTLTLNNTGNSPLTVNAIAYPSGYSSNWSSGTIVAGASQDITVSFTPTQALDYNGIVTITTNKTSGTNTVACSGTGVPIATFADWSTTAFTPEEMSDPSISGPLADPDNSGLNNLIRYAFSMNRSDITSPDLPVQTVVMDTESNNEAYNTTDFTLRNDPQLTYRIEVSSDMVNWYYNGDGQGGPYVTVTSADNGNGTSSIHAQDLTPVADTQPRYSRIVLVYE